MNERENKKGLVTKLLAIVIMLGALIAYVQVEEKNPIIKSGSNLSFVETETPWTYDHDSQVNFYSFDSKNFYICTKDGLQLAGEKPWNYPFSMVTPIMVGEGEYVAVAENKGKEIYVFNQTGFLHKQSYEFPILSFSLNKIGNLSVIHKDGEHYRVIVYNKSGSTELLNRAQNNANIFPVAVDTSNDGRIGVLSLMDINATMTFNLLFFYVNEEEGKNLSDRIFGAKTNPDNPEQIVSIVKFMDKNNIIYASEKEINCVEITQDGKTKDKWTMPLKNKIDQLAFNADKGFVICYGDKLMNKEGEEPGKVEFYNLDLVKTGEFNKLSKVTYISSGAGGAIVGSNKEFYAVDTKGKELWKYSATQDIKKLFYLENPNNLVLGTNTKATILKRVKTKEEENEKVNEDEIGKEN